MLQQLYIKNFTLIDELNIEFHSGFSVITGETGAGKSIILGAIGLLLGNRADSKQIKAGCDKCIIEAHFNLSNYNMEAFFQQKDIDYEPDDTILRRELTISGKSRAFINDTPVSLNAMRELGEVLVDIHSQHQNLLLQKEDFQLNVIDIIAQDSKLLNQYKQTYRCYKQAEKSLEQLQEQIVASKENEDFLRFQYNELKEAQLQKGVQEDLEQRSEMLSHAEEIKTALYEADRLLENEDNGIIDHVRQAMQSIQAIGPVYPNMQEVGNRLESTYIELKDIASEISSSVEHVDFDPNELDEVNEKLDTIYSLEQKFHVSTVNELIEQRDAIEEQLHSIDNSDEELLALQHEVEQQRKSCETVATQLTDLRQTTAEKIEQEMRQRLIPLGIPNVRFKICIDRKELTSDGWDKVQFLFSANKSTALQPVSQVASGGEIARVMLSLKVMISGAVKLPTIIFDEIDTGVSGKIAERMAQMMQEMGQQNRQVLSITHLPQIAAMGTTHYKVSKEETTQGTISHMRILSYKERVQELAQMLSGSDITPAAISNAEALLESHKRNSPTK